MMTERREALIETARSQGNRPHIRREECVKRNVRKAEEDVTWREKAVDRSNGK